MLSLKVCARNLCWILPVRTQSIKTQCVVECLSNDVMNFASSGFVSQHRPRKLVWDSCSFSKLCHLESQQRNKIIQCLWNNFPECFLSGEIEGLPFWHTLVNGTLPKYFPSFIEDRFTHFHFNLEWFFVPILHLTTLLFFTLYSISTRLTNFRNRGEVLEDVIQGFDPNRAAVAAKLQTCLKASQLQ